MRINSLAIAALLALTAACAHQPTIVAVSEDAQSTHLPAAEFELTRSDGSKVTWLHKGAEHKLFSESSSRDEYVVWTRPGESISSISVSLKRVYFQTYTAAEESASIMHMPHEVYFLQKCEVAPGAACEIVEGGKVVASVRQLGKPYG